MIMISNDTSVIISNGESEDSKSPSKWSGSSSQNEPLPLAGEVPLPRSDAPSSRPHITDVYSHEALGDGGSVAVVMELQIERIRRRIASLESVDDLPAVGGFGYYATRE